VQYQIIDTEISDSSSDEDNVLVLKPKSKKNKKNLAVKQSTLPIQNNYDSLNNKIDQLTKLMKKKKTKPKTKIIKVAAPIQVSQPISVPIAQPESMTEHMRKKLLNF
jgi:hypothetical protein